MSHAPEPVPAPDPLKLLLMDTCGSEVSIAIAEGGQLLEQTLLPGRRASEGLIGAIGDLLRGRHWRLRELDALVVVRGPGSFTGVRVGLSAAKALAEGSGRPLIAISRLEVLGQKAAPGSIGMLDAGRGEVFWAPVLATGVGEQAVAPLAWVVELARSLQRPLVCERCDMPELVGVDLHEVPTLTAADALPLATLRLALGQVNDPLLLDGLYLHRTEQEMLARQRSHQLPRVTGRSRS